MTMPLFSPRKAAPAATRADADDDASGVRQVPRGAARALGESSPPPSALRRMAHGFAREASAVVLMASGLYVVLALGSFKSDPMRPEVVGADWVGPVGAVFAHAAVSAVGFASWFVPVELFSIAIPMVSGKEGPTRGALGWLSRVSGNVAVITVLASLVHIALPTTTVFGGMKVGGDVGELCGEVLRSLFSTIGSYIIGLTIVALILVGRASFSFIEVLQRIGRFLTLLSEKGASGLRALENAWREARALEVAGEAREEPIIHREPEAGAIIAALSDEADEVDAPATEPSDVAFDVSSLVEAEPAVPPTDKRKKKAAAPEPPPEPASIPDEPESTPEPARRRGAKPPAEDVPTPSPIPPARTKSDGGAKATKVTDEAPRKPAKSEATDETIRIVDTSASQVIEKADVKVVPATGAGFRLPQVDFLDPPEQGQLSVDEAQLRETAGLLEKTLADYGVSGKVEEIHPGPTVTTFEVSPAAGTKVSKVASLADDLALGLSRKVRIIAPIPGKNRIGFEIPNPKRAAVSFRELIEDRRFVEMKAPLPCVLGRDIVGAPFFADLASMPHVIVAGATGAGKSVGLNVILVSLLYRKTPEELRLLMIDPKVVELAPFDGIPHMLLPVVTDMKQASNALRWAVDEMERRYQLFANAGTKNITTYNGFVERVARGEAKPPRQPAKVTAIGADGFDVEIDAAKDGTDAEPPQKLPFIVIVIDEFADLMMQQGKDVEASVARLAQKARAAGMHVILATQRPSVDVITGMIKANFPTRVAFRVSQKVDSRTILDEQGAEHLLGRGDMLVKLNGSNDMRRVQCPFISEEEAQRVTDFLRLQGKPVYDENILKPRDEDGQVAEEEDAEQDAMYDQAVRIVAETRRCSTSWLQRKLGIGYNRAAKIVETMERRGLVGPANGAKDREVLIEPI
jgi:S-DNA-T family DNA segregation ATPase FtsK/SpoIIIE